MQQHSGQFSCRSEPYTAMLLTLAPATLLSFRCTQKERAQSIQVRLRMRIERMPSTPSYHLCIVRVVNRSHQASAVVNGADELPGLQGVHGWLSVRCHGRERQRLGARQSLATSASNALDGVMYDGWSSAAARRAATSTAFGLLSGLWRSHMMKRVFCGFCCVHG